MSLILVFLSQMAFSAIFGTDDRYYVVPETPAWEASRSIAVGVLNTLHTPISPTNLGLDLEPVTDFLCKDQKFSETTSLSYACTGFLVASDLLVTAGHCSVNVGELRNNRGPHCETYAWMFDYRANMSGAVSNSFPAKDLYTCKEIIYAVVDEENPFNDWSLIRLDRPVFGREPLKLNPAPVSPDGEVTLVGHPAGMPMIAAPGGKVLVDNPERNQWVSSLDAIDGNSGSPVFNESWEVIGILTGGSPAFTFYGEGDEDCERYNRCDDHGNNCAVPDEDPSVLIGHQGTGSDIQRLGDLIKLLESL